MVNSRVVITVRNIPKLREQILAVNLAYTIYGQLSKLLVLLLSSEHNLVGF